MSIYIYIYTFGKLQWQVGNKKTEVYQKTNDEIKLRLLKAKWRYMYLPSLKFWKLNNCIRKNKVCKA